MKQLTFTYRVSGNELLISRKDKSITRATVNLAYHRVRALQASGTAVTGPKILGVFGASYLFPLFVDIGVIAQPTHTAVDWHSFLQRARDSNRIAGFFVRISIKNTRAANSKVTLCTGILYRPSA